MRAPVWRWVQVFLTAGLLVASVRLLWIFYQRRHPPQPTRPGAVASRPIPADYYVHIPRAYLTDFRSAQQLKGRTVWVRDGYQYAHFPFDASLWRSREIANPPLLAPIQKLTIADVVREPCQWPDKHEVNLVFEDPAAAPPLRSVTIGYCQRREDSCRFHFDEMFFLKDPRELYSHWPQEIWDAIARGEVREGMTMAQVSFAVGAGHVLRKETAAAEGDRVVEFRPPGRSPLVVTFDPEGNARRIQ